MSETRGLPSVEEVALLIHRRTEGTPTCECAIDDLATTGEDGLLDAAAAVLALFEAAVPRVKAEALANIRTIAGMHATGAVARGNSEERRRWLDLIIQCDRIESEAGKL